MTGLWVRLTPVLGAPLSLILFRDIGRIEIVIIIIVIIIIVIIIIIIIKLLGHTAMRQIHLVIKHIFLSVGVW